MPPAFFSGMAPDMPQGVRTQTCPLFRPRRGTLDQEATSSKSCGTPVAIKPACIDRTDLGPHPSPHVRRSGFRRWPAGELTSALRATSCGALGQTSSLTRAGRSSWAARAVAEERPRQTIDNGELVCRIARSCSTIASSGEHGGLKSTRPGGCQCIKGGRLGPHLAAYCPLGEHDIRHHRRVSLRDSGGGRENSTKVSVLVHLDDVTDIIPRSPPSV